MAVQLSQNTESRDTISGGEMGEKLERKRIQNPRRRHTTFSKRKNRFLKDALELYVLSDAEIAAIIFSETGEIQEFASHEDVTTILAKYRRQTETTTNAMPSSLQNAECDQLQHKMLHEKIEKLEKRKKNMVGENLESLTLKELQQLEKQLQKAIKRIYNKKTKILSQCSKSLVKKVRSLEEENTELLTRADASTSDAPLFVYAPLPKSHSDLGIENGSNNICSEAH